MKKLVPESVDYFINEEKDSKAKVRNRGDVVFPAESNAVKDDKDHFPINSIGQARNALARVGQYSTSPSWYDGTLENLQRKVKSAVRKKYPSIEINESLILEYQTYLQGGKGDKLTEKDVDPYQLEIGIEVEMEHTNNRAVAKEIALDHLAEHDDYYTILVEAGLVDEPEAIKLYKQLILGENYIKESLSYEEYMQEKGYEWEPWHDRYPAERELIDDDPEMADYSKEFANFNGENVKNSQDFQDRLENGDWIYNNKEFQVLASFIKEMDKKYGENNHSYGFGSDFEYYHPEFYNKLRKLK